MQANESVNESAKVSNKMSGNGNANSPSAMNPNPAGRVTNRHYVPRVLLNLNVDVRDLALACAGWRSEWRLNPNPNLGQSQCGQTRSMCACGRVGGGARNRSRSTARWVRRSTVWL